METIMPIAVRLLAPRAAMILMGAPPTITHEEYREKYHEKFVLFDYPNPGDKSMVTWEELQEIAGPQVEGYPEPLQSSNVWFLSAGYALTNHELTVEQKPAPVVHSNTVF